jgi:hypothetical protein
MRCVHTDVQLFETMHELGCQHLVTCLVLPISLHWLYAVWMCCATVGCATVGLMQMGAWAGLGAQYLHVWGLKDASPVLQWVAGACA